MISQRRAFFSFCFLFSFLLAFPILAAQVTHTFYPIGDTFIKDNGQNENEGLNTSLRLQQPDRSSHILLKFSQSNILNVIGSSQVVSANLKLYIETNFNNWGSGSSVDVHRMTEGWEEYISGSPAQGATWNCSVDLNLGNTQPNCTMQWEGGSYESTVLSSVFHQNGQTGWKVFNVTNDVQLIQNGSTHYGWLLRKPNPANQGSLDYTSIQGSASYKPRLEVIVDTTPSTITATVNPQPNSLGGITRM
ncbi:MAG TPA: DNRLRE domain-containing protein [Acidobacteriota bacterium]|nr:DNRLRE domain-containing protein [Acidobacteriota bacterium]